MVVGPVLATKHFEKNLLLCDSAKLVNISSICGSVSGKPQLKSGHTWFKEY